MNNVCILIIGMMVLVGLFNASYSQHSDIVSAMVNVDAAHAMKGANRLTLGLGHTHVSEGKVEGKTEWIIMPSWSLNYDYWLSDKWAVGLQNDLIMESFIIETNKEELIERAFPLTIVPVALFKTGKHLTLLSGIGVEIAKGHNLATTRLGFEYGFHLQGKWEVGASMVWDGKWNYYNSWGLAFSVSRIWSKQMHHSYSN